MPGEERSFTKAPDERNQSHPCHLKPHLVALTEISEETELYFHFRENRDWEMDPVVHKKQRKDGRGKGFALPTSGCQQRNDLTLMGPGDL